MRVVQSRCALYGLLIYRKGDRAGIFFSYGFYRNEVVLLGEAQYPTQSDIHEPKVPFIIYVDVRHMTDEAVPGVEEAPLAEFALGGTRVLGELKPGELHGVLFRLSGGKEGALLTALHYTTVRSGAIRP